MTNRRRFLSGVAGLVAWAKKPFMASPAASAIQPTCDPDAMMNYFASSVAIRCPNTAMRIVNIGMPYVASPVADKPMRVPFRGIPPDIMAAIDRVIRHESMLAREEITNLKVAHARLDDYLAGVYDKFGRDR